MSVVVTLSDGDAHVVPLGAAETVAALVDAIHDTLTLPHPAAAYDVFVGAGDDGCVRMEAALAEVGIHGCEERVVLRAKYAHVARAELQAEGITTAGAAADAMERAVEGGDVVRVRQIAAAGMASAGVIRRGIEAAIFAGEHDAAEAMLAGGIPVGMVQHLFFLACESGSVGVAGELLARGADLSGRDTYGDSVLHAACLYRHAEMAGILLSWGADANLKSSAGCTALHIACDLGCRELAQVLVDGGADVNAANLHGTTPLESARSNGHEEVVDVLVARQRADMQSKPIVAHGGVT